MNDLEIKRARELHKSVAALFPHKKVLITPVKKKTLPSFLAKKKAPVDFFPKKKKAPEIKIEIPKEKEYIKEYVFETPEAILNKLHSLPPGSIGSHMIDGGIPTAKDIILEMQSMKGNDRLDISAIRNGEHLAAAAGKITSGNFNMNDQRWHGGGGSSSSSTSVKVDPFTATASQTVFTASFSVTTSVLLTVGGIVQTPTTDYTTTSSAATLTAGSWPTGVPVGTPVIWIYTH